MCLSGFGHGDVIYPDKSRRIRIIALDTDFDFEQKELKNRGFTDKDISSGITAIIEFEFLNTGWPRVPFKQEPRLRYINLSGIGKVIEGGGDGKLFHAVQLDPMHTDALKRVAYLSMLPGQILEVFGSYDEFLKALGNRDMNGIDIAEMTPTQSLYKGSLRAFVENYYRLGERYNLAPD